MQDLSSEYDSSGIITDGTALMARASEDGFLFFRNLLPAEKVMDLRRDVLAILEEESLLCEEHSLMEGIASTKRVAELQNPAGTCGTREIYQKVQQMEKFHQLAHHPKVLEVFENLFGGDVLVHPRNIMRIVMPAEGVFPTDPHQDYIYINGSLDTWTSWIPLGDCPMPTGNLAVLKGSHRMGLLPVKDGRGAGGLCALVDDAEHDWIHFDFKCGDVLMFSSQTVHKSVPTQHPERIRLSLDFRYQSRSEPIHPSSLHPHMGYLNWEEVYSNWKSDGLKFYWEKHELNLSNNSYLDENPHLRQG
jgi:ectoine hydroxylase-related dioxygenase (phytanoyl-CoA dioxygenase family)